MNYHRGIRVQLMRTIHIQNHSAWKYVNLTEGVQRRPTPRVIVEGTCGVIDQMVDGSYSILFSIPLSSFKFAEMRLLLNETDFKLPDGKVLNFDQNKRRQKDAGTNC